MKCCVILYHKNIHKIYDPFWVAKCIVSIMNQTHKDFTVFELNYGDEERDEFLFDSVNHSFVRFYNKFDNHIGAMNFLITKAFSDGFDVVFNVNMDDYYAPHRFERQLEAIKSGVQLVSSNFYYMNDEKGIFKIMNMTEKGDVATELMRGHNVIAHPCVAMHKSFWEDHLHYNDLLGYEDLDLWQRAVKSGKNIQILPDHLLYYRIHDNQITKTFKGK